MGYQPVCGSNDKTYSNGCAANCEEVTVQYEGACTTTTNKYGGNGGYGAWATSTTKEKDDEEEANKEKDEEETKENEGCICPEVYQPVCGSNDKTYSNNCTANCEEVTVQYEGACTTTTNKYGGNGGYGAWAT